MKKYLPLFLIAVVILALNISEKNQPQHKLLISGIAVEQGTEQPLKFTLSIMEGEGEELKFKYKSAESENISEAVEQVSGTEGKEPIYSMCRWLVLSDRIDHEQKKNVIDFFINERTAIPKLALFGSRGKVAEYFSENETETSEILSLEKNIQTLSDYVNDGELLNTLEIANDGVISSNQKK